MKEFMKNDSSISKIYFTREYNKIKCSINNIEHR